ncbi:protein FAR-RED ELONGATED HYPOCOTYL 3 [Spinacia oleracea]|uniref:Protein FAR-RED ELONGATED HYPOCOTYL 3 n=1 Tax=Spinacia oleracea TaxID=3562 RepID=A0A9R0KD91_SPIOL|nr:protein FAR-RED ELONGATED HYPOCOTYL 3-like [Spinacia oleracea]
MTSSVSTLCSMNDFTSQASIDAILIEINADNSLILSALMKELSKEVVVVEEASASELMLKEVRSDNEAYEMYNVYGFRKGFSICKGLIRTSRRTDLWIMRRFVCTAFKDVRFVDSCFKDVKKETLRKYERSELRTCCTAFIQLCITKDGVWTVVRHNMTHNHHMIPAAKRYLLRSQRDITEEQPQVS